MKAWNELRRSAVYFPSPREARKAKRRKVNIMKRFLIAAAALATTLGLAGMASAEGKDHKGGREKLVFPMKADEFQKRIDGRLQKKKERIEKKLSEKQVPADKAKEIRDRFAENAAKIAAATKQVTSDGVVTEEEAKQVREVMHALHPHKGKGKGKGQKGA